MTIKLHGRPLGSAAIAPGGLIAARIGRFGSNLTENRLISMDFNVMRVRGGCVCVTGGGWGWVGVWGRGKMDGIMGLSQGN